MASLRNARHGYSTFFTLGATRAPVRSPRGAAANETPSQSADRFRARRHRRLDGRLQQVRHRRQRRGGPVAALHQAANDGHQPRRNGDRRRGGGQRAGAGLPALRARRQLEPALPGPRRRDGDQPDRRLHHRRLQRRRRVVRRHAGGLLDEGGRERPLPHLHCPALSRLGWPVRGAPEDGGRPGRHQPHLCAGRPHRLRHQPDVHGHGDPRRRVRALARGPSAGDHQRERWGRRSPSLRAEPFAHRGALPPLRRPHRVLAVGAFRRRERREDPRGQPRRDAAARRRRSARQRSEPDQARRCALHAQGNLTQRDGGHRDRPRPHHPRRGAGADRRAQHRRSDLHGPGAVRQRRHRGARLPQRGERPLHPSHPQCAHRERPFGGGPLPRAQRAPRRAHHRVVGGRSGERHERAVPHAAGLRHLHLRSGLWAEPARLQRPLDLGPQPGRRRDPRRSSATPSSSRIRPFPSASGRSTSGRPASTRRSAAPSSPTSRWGRRCSRAPSPCASSRGSRARRPRA